MQRNWTNYGNGIPQGTWSRYDTGYVLSYFVMLFVPLLVAPYRRKLPYSPRQIAFYAEASRKRVTVCVYDTPGNKNVQDTSFSSSDILLEGVPRPMKKAAVICYTLRSLWTASIPSPAALSKQSLLWKTALTSVQACRTMEQAPVQIGQFILGKNLGIGAFGKVRNQNDNDHDTS